MAKCRLLLLGPPQFESDAKPARISLRKAIALLAYLAVENRGFTREYLAALLWPDLGQDRSLANLRRVLSLLRTKFGHDCIVTDGGQVGLDRSYIDVDIDDFLSCSDTEEPDLLSLLAAAEVYRGGFLEGFNLGDCDEFDKWQDLVRERFRTTYDGLLKKIVVACLEKGQTEIGLPAARRWLELNRLNESAHRALMEIFGRSGRKDLVRKQFDLCVRTLAQEGLAPDDSTRELHSSLTRNGNNGAASTSPSSIWKRIWRGIRRPRWLIPTIIAAILAVSILTNWSRFAPLFVGYDLRIIELEEFRSGNKIEDIRVEFGNAVGHLKNVAYSITFCSDGSIDPPREFVVYTGELRFRPNSNLIVDLNCSEDIQMFVEEHDVRIPPGRYHVRATIDNTGDVIERAEHNNTFMIADSFYFDGSSRVPVFEIQLKLGEERSLENSDPFLVLIGDRTATADHGQWGRFTIAEEGTYCFSLDEIPRRDTDRSGYFLIVVQGPENSLHYPSFSNTEDMPALYKESEGNLVYGGFGSAGGTPIYPEGRYEIIYAPPAPPEADIYEIDNNDTAGTIIDYAALPVRQYHTLHNDGSGDVDHDWFRVYVKAGDSITVETFSGDGLWEADTAIDIKCPKLDYLGSNFDKSETDTYSKLMYTNTTGTDREFHFLIRPHNQSNFGNRRIGEYFVEFRE